MQMLRTTALAALLVISAMTCSDAADPASNSADCGPGVARSADGICAEPGVSLLTNTFFLQPLSGHSSERSADAERPPAWQGTAVHRGTPRPFVVYFFWGRGCPHCDTEKRFLAEMKGKYPSMTVKDHEVWYDKENAGLLSLMLKMRSAPPTGVPVTFIGGETFSGFNDRTRLAIEDQMKRCLRVPCGDPANREAAGIVWTSSGAAESPLVDIPFVGPIDLQQASIPVMTIVIAGLDGFNPCAFFVLLSLLGLLIHARSRGRMLLIGGTFVFFSGFIYFLFMAAWLNLFLVIGQLAAITTGAGAVSLIIAGINIKDFFAFKQGVSLSIPDSVKPRLFDRMRKLLREQSLAAILTGTTVLAVVANSYELLCTAGFPMVFTRLLTLHQLSASAYYFYLALYNTVYVVPLLAIVLTFTFTLGSRKLTEWQGRVLKLVSGVMMLGLGLVLLVDPALLNDVRISAALLAGALVVSFGIAAGMKRFAH